MKHKDKLMHLALGVLWLLVAAAVAWIQSAFGVGPALAASTTAYGCLYEFNQWYRREGKVEALDAACTALPGFVAWAILEIL